jgi:hypothetical protein
MSLTAANAAIQILATATKTLNAARERAQASKDATLKALINALYDEMAGLRESVQRVVDENNMLQRQQHAIPSPEPEIRQVGTAIYYYVGDKGPFCQPCYDLKNKRVMLTPLQNYTGGAGRKCEACNKIFFEGPSSQPRMQVKMYRG